MEVHVCVCECADIGVICTCRGNRWQGKLWVCICVCVCLNPPIKGDKGNKPVLQAIYVSPGSEMHFVLKHRGEGCLFYVPRLCIIVIEYNSRMVNCVFSLVLYVFPN